MAGSIEARLQEKGVTLPAVAAPAANYVPYVISGNTLYISGQVPFVEGKISHTGKLGAEFKVEDGYACARICAINILAAAKAALGDLDRIARVVKLTGFVNSTPDFTDQPKVVNGASDLMAEAFGDAGKHARSAVGVAQLPLGCAVEVEAIFEIR
ncbi:RidA family protein [Inquilinus limosus]|uniref:RidA family protein n=1 Tax=Inquilinus limosus TaxID=171674 RepID=UPI003F15818D